MTVEMTVDEILKQLTPKQKLDLREAINALASQPGSVRDTFVRRLAVGKESEQHEPERVIWSQENHGWETPTEKDGI